VFNRKAGYEDLPVTLPCGRCVGCRIRKSREWAVRCHHEASLHEQNSFVTLTYDDEHLPDDPDLGQPPGGTLVCRDLTLFLKRLQKRFGAGIRHYGCGEYGEKLGRPHYHLCIFNFSPPDLVLFKVREHLRLYTSETLDGLWGMGFTLTGDVTFQSAAYVARYVMKKINGPQSTSHYETVDQATGEITHKLPEFPAMSRDGIGKNFYEQYKSDIFPHDFVVIKGKKFPVPKYYDRQYEITDANDFARLRARRVRNAKLKSDNNTTARLRVRESVLLSKLDRLTRT